MNRWQYLIFDLDGTLIDSSPGILACFDAVLRDAGLKPVGNLDASLIGPPLRQTLMNITGLPAGEEVERLVVSFQGIYDSSGFKATRVYSGVEDMLAALSALGIPIAIATNKRRTPTMKILEYLNWQRYFDRVGTLDHDGGRYPDKAALIGGILVETGICAKKALYLGDKWEDGEAAAANGMTFFAAGWGYGSWDLQAMPRAWRMLRAPRELIAGLPEGDFPIEQ